MNLFGLHFGTAAEYKAEIRRRVFVARSQSGAVFDPERIDLTALRVAIAAYHGVGLDAVKEDSYFLRPMRVALREFGRYSQGFRSANLTVYEGAPPGVRTAPRTPSSTRLTRGAS